MTNTQVFRLAAVFGFLAVALGAFGAHALREHFAANGYANVWEKAVLYHALHAVVLLVLAARDPVPVLACVLFAAGIVIFSGSLYLLAFTGLHSLGRVTPVGGICLLAGWLTLALKG